MEVRVQKILSQWGIASRRQAEKMIESGRVKVNGRIVSLGDRADIAQDSIEVDGDKIELQQRPQSVYLLLHKPLGVVSTCDDPQGRTTVLDLLPQSLQHGQGIHPVGRLDINSSGALLLTNDGQLTLNLTHPRYHLPKTYRVWLQGNPSSRVLKQWRQGVWLDGKKTLPAEIRVVQTTGDRTCVKIVLRQGRNRQIRRVAEQLGHPVIGLHREAIGSISLRRSNGEYLAPKAYRHLSQVEIRALGQSFLSNSDTSNCEHSIIQSVSN